MNIRSLVSTIFLGSTLVSGCAQSPEMSQLESQLGDLIESFDGRAGVYVKHLDSGKEIAINADALYPTASMIKVPIMLKVFDRIENGELEYQQELTYTDSLFYSDSDIVGEFRDSATVSLAEMLFLSISRSDNTASLWLQELAGGGVAINEWLAAHGLEGTRMNSRTPDRRDDWEVYGWGQTTPREMAQLVEMIYTGEAVSEAASNEMLLLLSRPFWDGEALSRIPPSVQTASKNGAVSGSKSEVVLVHAPSGTYLFCAITADQSTTGYEQDDIGYEFVRSVSELIWDTFEPDSRYDMPSGWERYSDAEE